MLVLNLHRHWHAEIAEGRKTVEYRVVCPYWRSRLEKLAPGDIEATVDGIDFGPCPYPGWDGDFYRIRFHLSNPHSRVQGPTSKPTCDD